MNFDRNGRGNITFASSAHRSRASVGTSSCYGVYSTRIVVRSVRVDSPTILVALSNSLHYV